MHRAVRQLYGQKESIQLCPGEADCDKFQSSAGKTRQIVEKKVCHGHRGPKQPPDPCPMLATKTDEGRADHESLTELVNRAMAIRRERQAGYPRSLGRMTYPEYQAYVLASDCCESADRMRQDDIRQALLASVGVKAA